MAKLYTEIDKSLLKAIPNPSNEAYEIKVKIPEFTFLGVQEQPDFATIYLTFYPKKKIIELKKATMELNFGITNVNNRENIFYVDRISAEKVYQLPILPSFGMAFAF